MMEPTIAFGTRSFRFVVATTIIGGLVACTKEGSVGNSLPPVNSKSESPVGELPRSAQTMGSTEHVIAVQQRYLNAPTDSLAPGRLFSSVNWNPPKPPEKVIAAPPVAPTAPPLPFAFLGKKRDLDGWEIYVTRGDRTFILREGMNFDNNYRVEKIDPPSLTLTYIPLGLAQTLAIGDSR